MLTCTNRKFRRLNWNRSDKDQKDNSHNMVVGQQIHDTEQNIHFYLIKASNSFVFLARLKSAYAAEDKIMKI